MKVSHFESFEVERRLVSLLMGLLKNNVSWHDRGIGFMYLEGYCVHKSLVTILLL
jgi:hypothetical protein